MGKINLFITTKFVFQTFKKLLSNYKLGDFIEFGPDIELLQQFVENCVTICKMMGNRRIEEGRWRYRKILRLAKNKRKKKLCHFFQNKHQTEGVEIF